MGNYHPPFSITNEILSYVSSISEKIKSWMKFLFNSARMMIKFRKTSKSC